MPTTATVAPRQVYSGADIASGLRQIADLVEGKPWIAAGVKQPAVPQRLHLGLAHRSDIEALAVVLGAPVEEAKHDDHMFVSTTAQLDGVILSAYSVIDHTRILRRDPEATAVLAERDA